MGWFRRAAKAINESPPTPMLDLVMALDLAQRRVRRLEANGTPANGAITGIAFSLNDDTTRREYAVSTVVGGEVHRYGVRVRSEAPEHRLRLGLPVVLRVDGDRGILDWAAMAGAWNLADGFLPQEPIRRPPADGVVDSSTDMSVQRRLRKWTPTDATITSLQRCFVLGMPTRNWDIELRLADGGTARVARDAVPGYAHWDAAPGTSVRAVVDPKDPSRAAVDWPAVALARWSAAGFDDDPPKGSLAAELDAALVAGPPATPAAVSVQPVAAPVAPLQAAAPDGTIRSWIDAYLGGHLSQKDLEQSLRDWRAAGMCTDEAVAAARAACGLP